MNISFKGYDAVPLKSVYIEKVTSPPIKSEMKRIAALEGFKLRMATDCLKWAQDDKTIIQRNGQPHLIGNVRVDNVPGPLVVVPVVPSRMAPAISILVVTALFCRPTPES